MKAVRSRRSFSLVLCLRGTEPPKTWRRSRIQTILTRKRKRQNQRSSNLMLKTPKVKVQRKKWLKIQSLARLRKLRKRSQKKTTRRQNLWMAKGKRNKQSQSSKNKKRLSNRPLQSQRRGRSISIILSKSLTILRELHLKSTQSSRKLKILC